MTDERLQNELKDRLALVDEIYRLSMEINKGNDFDCWFYTQPHVGMISVSVSPKGNYSNSVVREKAWYDSDWKTHDAMVKDLREIILVLDHYRRGIDVLNPSLIREEQEHANI